ncbi:MAG: ribonucleoside-diphosphate reductase subunit alpha, partial [Xanthomonadales bacterium]|nr:ribonucleoside-diphosphate reductase subunit alpha [Xanthomonadales bacterium]
VEGLAGVDKELILKDAYRNIFDGIAEKDLSSAIIMSARQHIEKDPNYSRVAARLLLDSLRKEALSFLYGEEREATQSQMVELYPSSFKKYIHKAVELELLSPELTNYDLDKLGQAIKPERDLNFTYLGFQTLYDRYFIHSGKNRIELPQSFFMRVSMGLAINEVDREERAIEFYNLLSSFDFMSSTPTLFNSGTLRPQLSSCYLTTVPDDLKGIFSAITDDALLSKYAGGLGNDWSRVRGLGARIKGTNGESQGVVPFLKVANDTAVAVNQGGKRKGAMCAYL